jgi:calcium binding protein 39
MAFLFGGNRRQKQPTEIAKSLKELLHRLWEPAISPKVEEEVAKHMASMKLIVQGTPGSCDQRAKPNQRTEVTLQKSTAAPNRCISSSAASFKKISSTSSPEVSD